MSEPYHHTFRPWRATETARVVASEATWRKPLAWNRAAAAAGERRRVRVKCEVFDAWLGPMTNAKGEQIIRPWLDRESNNWSSVDPETFARDPQGYLPVTLDNARSRLFSLIDQTPSLDWCIATAYPENAAGMMPRCNDCVGMTAGRGGVPADFRCCHCARPNLWLGITASTQAEADARIPHLLGVPAAVRYAELTPVESLDFEAWLSVEYRLLNPQLDWLHVSGETGRNARPCHPDWVRSLRDQCQTAAVPFWFAGWGEWLELGHGEPDRTLGQSHPDFKSRLKLCDGFVSKCGHFITSFKQAAALVEYRGLQRVGSAASGSLLEGRKWEHLPGRE